MCERTRRGGALGCTFKVVETIRKDKMDKMKILGVLLLLVLVWVLAASTAMYFGTETNVFVVDGPSKEQVIQLTQADPDNLVWFEDAAQLYQGSSLIKFEFRTRTFDDYRIEQFLSKVGVRYQLIRREGRW